MVDDNTELNPNDPAVREARERAVDYADRVAAGEEPWLDGDEGSEAADAGFEVADDPRDDDVGETEGSASPEVVENPDPVEPTE